MAKHKVGAITITCPIYIEGQCPSVDDLNGGFWYQYKKSKLEIFDKEGDKIACIKVEVGDGVNVVIRGKKIIIRPIDLPETRSGKVGHLLGCNRGMRVKSRELLERKIIEGVQVYRVKGEHFELIQELDDSEKGRRNIFVWIANEISNDEILSLVPYMTAHSNEYNQVLMKKFFNINEEDYKNALNG